MTLNYFLVVLGAAAEKGDKECPFCITFDEFKRRMGNED